MRTSSARHARPRAFSRRVRSAAALAGASALCASALIGPAAVPGAAAGSDPCLTPQVTEVMVNQGVASYAQLARGKTTLVKYFLRLPTCAPAGTTMQITGGTLIMSSGARVPLDGALPLPSIGTASTSPVPAAASDPLFVVPGRDVVPDASGRITFVADLDYRVTAPGAQPAPGGLTVDRLPGTNLPVTAVVAPAVKPLRVLVVPMGDKGTLRQPTAYRDQYPLSAEQGTHRGMISLSRQLPVPDSQGETLAATSPGLRYSINAGLLHLGEHLEDGVTRNYVQNGKFCGDLVNATYVGAQLQLFRTAWNSVNTGQADFALGQVWEGVSSGQSTDPGTNCADGAAHINAKQAWGRVVGPTAVRPDVTGAIAAMELVHNLGQLPEDDHRHGGGFHSKNLEADVTAPERAWNILDRTWLPLDRSTMNYTPAGWHGNNALLEKEDWSRTQCVLVSGGAPDSGCGIPGGLGTAFAGTSTDTGSFFVSGSTDGTADGTEVHTYRTDGRTYDEPVPASPYRFIQRDLLGAVVKDSGLSVGTRLDTHHAAGGTGHGAQLPDGVFGTQFPADLRTRTIEIWKGAPGAPGSVLLHQRAQDGAPRVASVSVGGRSVSVTVADDRPADLRLDLFLACDGQTSPLAVAERPLTTTGAVAAFVTTYDTGLGCPLGRLITRVTDGFSTTTAEELVPSPTAGTGVAAIYAPTAGRVAKQFEAIALSGTGRDALERPAHELAWLLHGPGHAVPTRVASGPNAVLALPGGLQPGEYTVTLRALGSEGALLAETSTALRVLPDRDRDLLPDPGDRYCKDGADASADDRNATQDSDRDGDADVVDSDPCTSGSTLGVRFQPDSFRTSSSGVPLTFVLTSRTTDLTTLHLEDLLVTQVAGFPTRIPGLSYRASSPGVAELKVDRALVSRLLVSQQLTGYVPIFVGTADKHLRGTDPDYPHVFP